MARFDFDNLNFYIPPEVLWGITSLVLVFFLISGLVLNYHWKNYGIGNNPRVFAKTLFWLVSLILIGVMTIAVLYYESSLLNL